MPPINLYELGFDKVYIKIINYSNYISQYSVNSYVID